MRFAGRLLLIWLQVVYGLAMRLCGLAGWFPRAARRANRDPGDDRLAPRTCLAVSCHEVLSSDACVPHILNCIALLAAPFHADRGQNDDMDYIGRQVR